MSEFKITNESFTLDGKPYRIISGSMHYFRILPEYWEDRLTKLKACGFNTVETYVPWNMHERNEGEYDFSGVLDIEQYLRTAQKVGLNAIVRPSPYICAEWEFGGLPAWLLKYDLELRCCDPLYLEKVANYYDVLIPRLAAFQCTKGGPLLMMQIENEYGSYGNDSDYLRFLKDNMIKNGIEVPLFTSDGGCDLMLTGGTLPEIYKTVNFGSRPDENFAMLKKHQPDKPLMCAEYWNGWFDHWGEEHHVREGNDVAECCEEMLKMGASVNFYMFHGGTNFGFMNGANHHKNNGGFLPTVTSYDYDCLLSEEGNITQKYLDVKAMLKRYGFENDVEVATPVTPKCYGEIEFTQCASLSSLVKSASEHHFSYPIKPMEHFGQNYGYILYRTKVRKVGPSPITLREVHDRAHVFVDGKRIGIIYRNDEEQSIDYDFKSDESVLEIFVENMGRVNYGSELKDYKGITRDVFVGQQLQFGWDVFCIDLDNITKPEFSPCSIDKVEEPMLLKAEFEIDEVSDTYFRADNFKKGQVWVNYFNLGRYWNDAGPQKTLYIPAALLKKGKNELVIFETDSSENLKVTLTDKRDLG